MSQKIYWLLWTTENNIENVDNLRQKSRIQARKLKSQKSKLGQKLLQTIEKSLFEMHYSNCNPPTNLNLFQAMKSHSLFKLIYVTVRIKCSSQGLLYHRTSKPDFLCRWPSINSYLDLREIFWVSAVSMILHCIKNFPLF